jgi:hypothetical protein
MGFVPLLHRTMQFSGQPQVAEFKDSDESPPWRDLAIGEKLGKFTG